MSSRVAVLSGLESYMAGREERAGQIGTHVLSRVPDYSATDIRLDPAEEAVMGLGRCVRARELPETAVEAAQTLRVHEGSPGIARRGSPKQLPPLEVSKEDLRATPVETRARPTWLDAVQLHSLANPAINGALAPLPADDELERDQLAPPRSPSPSKRPTGGSLPPDAEAPPFAAFSPSGGDISAISCRYLGGFGETNGFDSPAKFPRRQSQQGSSGSVQRRAGDSKQVHGYRRQKTYHERMAEQRRRYMTEEYARIRTAKEAREAEERQRLQELQEEEQRAKREWERRREQALRRREEQEAAEQAQVENEAAVSLQAGTRAMLTRRQHKERLNYPVTLLALLGGPGSGKTTVCEHLVQLAGQMGSAGSTIAFKHLSSGRMLRRAVENKSHPEWLVIMTCMDDGNTVPDQIVIEVVMAELKRFRFQSAGTVEQPVCLLDNFPSNVTQLELLQRQVGALSAVFVLEVDEGTMLNRVMYRASRSTPTHTTPGGPQGTPTRPRRDDKEETAHATIARYNERVKPLLTDYESQLQQPPEEGKAPSIGAVVRIDAERAVEEICNQIAEHLVQALKAN
jgi:adenylate kinase family enzyme